MDPSEGHPINYDMLEECFGLWYNQQNAVGSTSIPNEELQMSDFPDLFRGQQPSSPSLGISDAPDLYAQVDMPNSGNENEEVRFASTRP